MSDVEFNRTEIEALTSKLDSPQLQLSDRERVLLRAIFAAAGSQVRRRGAGTGEQESALANLREELLNSFIPGEATEFSIPPPDIFDDR
jgi:hypothetical protein